MSCCMPVPHPIVVVKSKRQSAPQNFAGVGSSFTLGAPWIGMTILAGSGPGSGLHNFVSTQGQLPAGVGGPEPPLQKDSILVGLQAPRNLSVMHIRQWPTLTARAVAQNPSSACGLGHSSWCR